MNERIRLLAEQAGIEFTYDPTETPMRAFVECWEDEMAKFAELIVAECLGCCEQVISDPVPESVDTWLNGGSQCIDEIKQHFGVEE